VITPVLQITQWKKHNINVSQVQNGFPTTQSVTTSCEYFLVTGKNMSWLNIQHVPSKTHMYNVLWIFNDHPPSFYHEKWFLSYSEGFHFMSFIIKRSGFYPIQKVSTSCPWLNTLQHGVQTLEAECNGLSNHKHISSTSH
jgi:hypothetical protein